ncbi:MAG TPA: NAD(P)/FAD-dependent oxidoreductase [Stellaceae bacterium]|nr:NAD(P)/FAD-dependent oxidoreductase [Stellaceae bacterium]
MTIEAPDVVVVGLGPAGSRAAAAAAAGGARVVALERREEAGRPVQCAEFVPALLDQEVAGLAPVTVQTIERMLTFVEEDAADETPNFPGRMIDRADFDRLLADRAAKAGVICRYGVSAVAVARDGTIHVSDGSRLRPRLLIGADGPRSRVGAAFGAINHALVETRQVTVPLFRPHDATDIFLRADYVGGYAWLFPKGSVANLGLGFDAKSSSRLKPLLIELQRQLVAEGRIGGEVSCLTGGAIPVGGRRAAVGAIGDLPVLLTGDAAGLTNPVTGAGIAAAVQSGTMAGAAAARWLGGQRCALADYEEELADLFDAALSCARRQRTALLACYREGATPTPSALRRGWIAYPQYWAA